MNWYLIWKYKHWIAIAVLSFMYLGQVAYTNHLGGELRTAEAKHQAYIDNQEKLLVLARADAAVKEKQWSEQLLKAERNYNVRIKQIAADAASAQSAADSLSKQLDTAKSRMSTAPRETIIKYVNTSSDILKECVAEYRTLAEAADGHAADAKRLIDAWPSE
ncbi:hypothetical protein [Acinetobacter larvae]|uniref:Uncharacterized protein n=1 Tax=Acinetobacter larvae TaxID=1789224 RepID=A0A1B2LZA9_9GAMM|nr:hypothetical protein [Acinetobacter larvae]AOA58288.1 hypothetical protein BFG52_07900 [Acinetobacter larvae]